MPSAMPATPNFVSSTFALQYNSAVFESPLSRQQQILERAGARWMGSFSLPPMKRDQAAPWLAFLTSLRGQAQTFYGFDPDCRAPQGSNVQVGASTNYIQNGDGIGGSAGVAPTGWSVSAGGGVTVTHLGSGSITVGTNVIKGAYIRLQASPSSSSSSFTIAPQSVANTQQVAANGEQWSGTMYVAVTGGAVTNFNLIRMLMLEADAAGSQVQSNNGPTIQGSLTDTPQRFTYTVTLNGTGTTRVRNVLYGTYNSGVALDITLFIGAVQCEKSPVSPYIATSGAVASRNANVRVYGAGQSGGSLVVRGFAANTNGLLKAGDYFQLEGRLYMVSADVASDFQGVATIQLAPSLRSAPVNDALLTFTSPVCEMRLVDDNQASWQADKNGVFNISFSGVEVLP